MKNWGTQEQKGEVLLMGASLLSGFISDIINDSKITENKIEEAKKDGKYSKQEYEYLEQEFKIYKGYVENILGDSELGCKFKKTETYFLEVVWIIMLDLESDYSELIRSFVNHIDNEGFVESFEAAKQQRENRLNKEFEPILKDYYIKLQLYNQKLKDYSSKNFLSKAFSDKPIEPIKPERRK